MCRCKCKCKKDKNNKSKWIRRFIKYGLAIAFIALLIWLLLHMFDEFQSTIVGLQEQINQQNTQITDLKAQLQTSLDTNTQLQVKINGLQEYIVDQNNVIHDLKDHVQLNQPQVQPEEQVNPKLNQESKMPSVGDIVRNPSIMVPPLIIGGMEVGRRLLSPIRMLNGGF